MKSRETAGQKLASGCEGFGTGEAKLRVGIDGGAVAIVGDFEAAGFEVGHAVEFVAKDEPSGEGGGLKARVAERNAEEENFLEGVEDTIGEEVGEKFWEPRATGEDEFRGGNIFAGVGGREFMELAAKC